MPYQHSLDDQKLPHPAHEEVSRGVSLLPSLRALERVQHLIALILARPRLVLAHERGGIRDAADDVPIDQPDSRRKGKLRLHVCITEGARRRFQPSRSYAKD